MRSNGSWASSGSVGCHCASVVHEGFAPDRDHRQGGQLGEATRQADTWGVRDGPGRVRREDRQAFNNGPDTGSGRWAEREMGKNAEEGGGGGGAREEEGPRKRPAGGRKRWWEIGTQRETATHRARDGLGGPIPGWREHREEEVGMRCVAKNASFRWMDRRMDGEKVRGGGP